MKRKWLTIGISILVIILLASHVIPTTRIVSGKQVAYNPNPAERGIVFSDSFETYEDFIVDDFQLWTTFDGDGGQTKGLEGTDWPNEYYTGSFMIFNPIYTTPPLNSTYYAHTGIKYISCWDTVPVMAPNDDWLFTPLLSADTFEMVTLWARSLDDQYGLEDFEIGISTNDPDPTSVTILQTNNDVPVNWTQYTLDISAYSGQFIYIAIHVFSSDDFAFGMDDFEVTGASGPCDITPPITTCTLEGTVEGDIYTSDVTVILSATDEWSGVNYTKCKINDGAWTDYTGSFDVTDDGSHTVLFYSVDNAGNEETEKSSTFTIQHALPVEITIKGGFGVSALIKNMGTADLANIDWMITLDGKFIFIGKTQSGTIANLAVGKSVAVKDLVVGYGPITITVTVADEEKTASGFLFLFFVIGV